MNKFAQKAPEPEQAALKNFLQNYLNRKNDEQTIPAILCETGSYYDADRAYIFELNSRRTEVSKTYEWCKEGVSASIDALQNVSINGLEYWLYALEEKGEFFISSLSDEFGENTPTYQLLKPLGVESLAAAPLIVDGSVVGFFGLDNPRKNCGHVLLLSVIASTCCSEITHKRLENLNKKLTERMKIIQSMSEIYTSVYYIDLEEQSFQEIFSSDDLHHSYGEKGNAKEYLKTAVEAFVKDDFKPVMRSFIDTDTLNERIGTKKIITQEYMTVNDEWIRCSFIPTQKDESGRNVKVICGLRRITVEKKAIKSQDNLIRALSMSYENVYAVNMDTTEGICYRMNKTMTDRYGEEFAAGDYDHSIKLYIENDVYEDDKYLFDRISSLSAVRELLSDKQMYSFNYRVFRNNIIQYFQCQIVKPSAERNEFALGFKNIDEEKKQEIAQQKKIEDALAAVEKINAALQDEMDIAGALSKDFPDVVLLDLTNNIATTIKRQEKILAEGERTTRRSYDDLWNNYILKYVYDEDRDSISAAVSMNVIRKALENSDEYTCNYRIIYDDTGIHHFQAAFIRIFSRRADESQIILGFRNVDAIVEEERKHIKIQEEQFRIIEALSHEYHSLFKIDAITGKLSLYRTDGIGMERSQLNKLMFIEKYEDILSKYIDTFIVPEDRERIRNATGLDVLIQRVPDAGLYKLGYRRNMNGDISYYEMNVAKTVDDSGMITFILGLCDVNDEMQRQLRQAREIEAQSEIIECLGSEYYSILLVNPEDDKVTPYRAYEKDGMDIANYFTSYDFCWSKGLASYSEELVSEKCRKEFMEKLCLERIRKGGKDYSFTYEKLSGDGIIYLQVRISFVREKDGGFAAVIGTRNVDDLIKKERQQEMALQAAYDAAEAASKAKTDFLSNMSHDIRTPMNCIIGMTAIAATHIDDKERIQDSLQKISLASKHMLSLINEVLDMSKIESGKVDLNEEEFNLSNLVDNLISMTSSQIDQHHHELSINISGVEHEEVIGDSLRIQKVFTNLMSNAVKYTPDGGKIRLSIREKPCSQAKVGCYEFIFEDNGIGMTEEYIEKIFEPFTRATDRRVNKIQGTGLGMPISRNIVRMMGGDIKVESKLNVGSKFTVTMYLKLQEAIDIPHDKFIDLNVLVADDDRLSLESCCDILRDFGMNADGVSTGAEAVEQVVLRHGEERDYFACIIDWKMPEMDGIATTRAIRRAVGNDVPIIIISAYDWSDIEQEARAAGANAFISKPLFRSRLVKTINALVGEEEAPEPQEEPLMGGLSDMNFTDRRVLLVEDNDLNAEIAAEILEMTGLVVERAVDGTEAVDMMSTCEDGYYDIIFMDIQMPKMNGYDATRVIRSMDRNYCRQIPIVAMTANAFAEDVQAAKTVGMNEHIAKPLDLRHLARTLERWLG